ncbi:MAG: C39 family peptidase [Aromatoleum sp.]|jgi:predicted double-glycine peptidase|uniref:C39 family peptidase n=1 Tax=Aromatoleum sp. TaxID=2307007 RepID=UPI002894F2CA|nr:C39 family peptidase [Aromatoleum sp.]MDT3669791.1 C39 family peptidase [Aromatoleum sp.]
MDVRRLLSSIALAQCLCATAFGGAPQMLAPGGGSYTVPITSLKGTRFLSTIRQQYDFSCGSAAVATLLTHQYGKNVDEVAVFKQMYERGDQAKIRREGFSMLDMKLYLDGTGFRAEGVKVDLDQLAAAKVPAIALVRENGYSHFVVIKGVRDGRVVIGDPAMGTRVLARSDFEKNWTNGILLVINNRVDLAQFNNERDWSVRPKAPIGNALGAGSGADVMLLRRGPMDF